MDARPRMFVFRPRAFVTLLTAFSFVIMTVSGVILYTAPSGRRAGDWNVWTLSRDQWIALHLTFSAVFIIAAVLHLCFNLKCFLHYLKIKTKAAVGLRWEWLAVAILTAIVIWGTLKPFEPFAALLRQRDKFYRRPAAAQVQTQADRTGLGQLTLNDYCRQIGLDINLAISALKEEGIAADKADTLRVIADRAGLHPSQLRSLLDAARTQR